MRFFRIAVLSLLLITTPALLADFHQIAFHAKLDKKFKQEETYHLISYDKILKILDEVESGKAKKKYKKRELARINQFLVYLAQNGTTQQNVTALNHDISDLLHEGDFNPSINTCWIFWPTGWTPTFLSINFGKTKKFVKKHKTAIIIGGAILVATGIVIIAASAGAASAGVASAAGVAGGFATSELKNTEITSEAPAIQEYISEKIHASAFEETSDLSIGEMARELGSKFAHETFDGISEFVSIVPNAAQEIKDVGSQFVPNGFIPPASRDLTADPQEKYENFVVRGHGMIDNIFSTNQADQYTPEGRDTRFNTGIIPLPGMIYKNGTINVKKFSNLGKSADRAGYTKAGRGITKHSYRDGSIFPKPTGNLSEVNQHGQRALESILNHPEKKVVQYTHKKYGPVIEIEAPKLGGVRFNGDGSEMMGLLEPHRFK